MLINCTNHPYRLWNTRQREAALAYGQVVDLPFPSVEPTCTTAQLQEMTKTFATQIKAMNPDAVLVAGEYSFTFMLVDCLLSDGIQVLCSRSKRITTEVKKEDGTNEKTTIFDFEGFYPYAYYDRERKHRP